MLALSNLRLALVEVAFSMGWRVVYSTVHIYGFNIFYLKEMSLYSVGLLNRAVFVCM